MNFSRRTLLRGLGIAAAGFLPQIALAKTNQIKDLQAAIDKAIEGDGVLRLAAGTYETPGIRIDKPMRIEGIPGLTKIVCPPGGPILIIDGAHDVTLFGLTFSGDRKPVPDDNSGAAMVIAGDADGLVIESCAFVTSSLSALRLESCSGRVVGNRFSEIDASAIFALDSNGLEISGNTLTDIGNNGIQVWTSVPREDGTIVRNNRINKVSARDGGSGQNGNGINVYRAGNVIVSENRITDCVFSAVRNNAGSNCQIVNNSISRMGEVAIYCEFGFEGAVVSGNLIEDVALGISVTNFNEGGRLATVANNVIRRAKGGGTIPQTNGVGIGAEGDATVIGNVVEDARDAGISLGWGPYSRTLMATGNLVRNAPKGIVFSMSEGADGVLIANNRISGANIASIMGTEHGEPRTGDLGIAGAVMPAGIQISGNLTD